MLQDMKILHVDDHQLFVEGLRAVLEHDKHGFTVVCARSADEALQQIEDNDDFDLVLTDINMPGMDGLALLRAIFERGLLVPVVVMSAVEDLWQIKRSMDEGAMGFIPKAFSTQEIIAAMELVVAGETFLPEGVAQALANLPDKEPEDEVARIAASYHITKRQLEVLKLMQEGYSNQDIAKILSLSEHTVKSHARVLFQAFGVANRIECVRYAERLGLVAAR